MGHPTLACHTVFACTVPCLQSRVYVQQYFTSTSITNKFQEKDSGFYFDVDKLVSWLYTRAIYTI